MPVCKYTTKTITITITRSGYIKQPITIRCRNKNNLILNQETEAPGAGLARDTSAIAQALAPIELLVQPDEDEAEGSCGQDGYEGGDTVDGHSSD